jgi:dCMP deaminase
MSELTPVDYYTDGRYHLPTAVDQRPTFSQTFMTIAKAVAERGTCPRLKVGAVLATRDNRIIATGYNGSPAGLPHCTEVGCLRQDCQRCKGDGVWHLDTMDMHGYTTREVRFDTQCPLCKGGGKEGGCKRTTHAEANALIQCARLGHATEGATLYVTHRPCVACAGLIITAGIYRVEWSHNYKTDGLANDVTGMLASAGVEYLGGNIR